VFYPLKHGQKIPGTKDKFDEVAYYGRLLLAREAHTQRNGDARQLVGCVWSRWLAPRSAAAFSV